MTPVTRVWRFSLNRASRLTSLSTSLRALRRRDGIGEQLGYGADSAAAADATMVDIKDFTLVPDPLEIPVGATVTWTNSDAVPHTATAQDREALQSGTLNQGDSYSQTFDQPGTFDYFCEFHANMKGTIVVQ